MHPGSNTLPASESGSGSLSASNSRPLIVILENDFFRLRARSKNSVAGRHSHFHFLLVDAVSPLPFSIRLR
jgi:hypothetical protein